MTQEIINKINKLKQEKNAIILTHCYQNIEIDEVSDYVGDSLYLSQMAAKTDADIIIFAGVYFMAQTAKILSPNKKVLLPTLESGCRMADMIDIKQIKEFKSNFYDMPVVCYINTTAEVKTECDICCTSSNAVQIVKSLNAKEILFVPDTYLGKWVESQLENVKVNTYPGFCPTHLQIREKHMIEARAKYPNAKILAHPECHSEVVKLADYVGSTTGIMNYAINSNEKQFVIATEEGVIDRLRRDCKDKEFILIKDKVICPNMKFNTLSEILNCLEKEEHEIFIKEEVATKALTCLNNMLDVSKNKVGV
ncbi:MAG: quinolinate synthase NadA [Candidatus Gastranaerophilales bacterium]